MIFSVFSGISGSVGILSIEASGFEPCFSGGNGTASDPYSISNVTELQWMANTSNLDKHFVLVNDINASVTKTWNSGAGFVPIGTSSNTFIGRLDGNGYNITDLHINRSSIDYVGIFGYTGNGASIKDLNIVRSNITGGNYIGGLVGRNEGTVTNCSTAGNTSGTDFVGGLVGSNSGAVTHCHATGSKSGTDIIGGLVGCNSYGTVKNCYSTGNVNGKNYVGGLVGYGFFSTVRDCYAAGNTIGINIVGGLVGYNDHYSTMTNCYAVGNTSGIGRVGGLVGINSETVTNCYATGNTGGNVRVGGLVGDNYYGTVRDSYAMVTVTRSSGTNTSFGGFVGLNYYGKILRSYSTGRVIYSGATDPTDKGFTGSVDTGGNYEMTGNFWDNQTSGQNSTAGKATGKNTTEMMTIDIFASAKWDIVHVRDHVSETWYIDDGNDYPRLYWEPYVDVYPPIADAGPDQTVNEGAEVTFNGSGSSDNIRVVNWTWTFFDGYLVTIYRVGSTYIFHDPGTFIVTLNVTDAVGNSDEDTMKVTVLDITSPIADAGPDQTVNEGTKVTFNGSGSRDNVGVVNWTWTFHDGMKNIYLFGSAPSHTFNVPGIFVVTLNISDAASNWATDTMRVTVNDITPPVANAGPDQVVDEGDTVTFDGTGSSDNVGILNFTWTFTHIVPMTLYGVQPEYTFIEPGVFTVKLIVTDTAGNSFSDTMTVRVNDMIPPVADAGPDIVVEVGTIVLFNGSGSHDNVGISNYTWKFFYGHDYVTLYGVDPRFKFYLPGFFIVILYVTDDTGWQEEDEVKVTVRDTTEPHAYAGPDQIVIPGYFITFSATGSYDNFRIEKYSWTFRDVTENDVYYGISLYGISPQYRFLHTGVFTVTLEVTDAVGLRDTDNVIITVLGYTLSIHGNVLDENGDPVEGANVEINATDGETYNTVTRADGSFLQEVPKGPFTWRISKEGYDELSGGSSTENLGDLTIKLKESPTTNDDDRIVTILILVSLILSLLVLTGIAIFLISRRRNEVIMEE